MLASLLCLALLPIPLGLEVFNSDCPENMLSWFWNMILAVYTLSKIGKVIKFVKKKEKKKD